MNRQVIARHWRLAWPLLAVFAWPIIGNAQVAVAEIEELEEFPTISASEIEDLVGPIALYPDDLLAIVLPASTFPLQVVEAFRFLEDLETNPELKPDEDWDDSIVALLNYPEVVELMNEDLDWTWRLGEAVVAQQSDVIAAIEAFRDRAYAAGNLKSDDYQLVSQEEGTIQITPVQDDVIYVPYYEPEQVVIYQPRPVYYYYPRPYPVYYYPYPSYYSFNRHFYYDRFWGVTTAFSIGWHAYHLNVFHHSFHGHPYYGRSYWDRWWYRRPDIHVYNNTYVRNINVSYNRYRDGDQWVPRDRRTVRQSDQRITRTRTYPSSNAAPTSHGNASSFTSNGTNRNALNREVGTSARHVRRSDEPEIRFRNRPSPTPDTRTSGSVIPRTDTTARSAPAPRRSAQPGSTSQPRSSTQKRSVAEPRPGVSNRYNSEPRPDISNRSSAQPRSSVAPRSSSQPRSSAPTRSSAPSRSSAPTRSSAPSRSSAKPRSSSAPKASSQRSSPSRASKPSRSSNKSSRSSSSRKRDH